MIRLLVEDVGAMAAAVGQAELGATDEIDGDVVLEDTDVRMVAKLACQGVLSSVMEASRCRPTMA